MIDYGEITGRKKISFIKKFSVFWWWMNEGEQTVDSAPWYHPEWSYWRRWIYWNLFRNPLQNLRNYVIGVGDKNYKVLGRKPVWTVQRNDLDPPETGFQWCVLYSGDLWVPRAFISYSGTHTVWYLGWQPNGFFGAKFNLHKA